MNGSIAQHAATFTTVTRQVALFRGINVGGHNKIPMAELRDTFEALGYLDVVSIIQSGNVCFDSSNDPSAIEAAVCSAVVQRFDVDVPIILRTKEDFDTALAAHPFVTGDLEPKMHHIMFLAEPADPRAEELLGDHSPDEYAVIGRELHVRYPAGSARSKLSVDLVDRRLSSTATARNLPTCQKIAAALAGSREGQLQPLVVPQSPQT
jgi:uncharacterized protein (DUF1697 family)